jgi:hypothetical protein
MAFKAEKSGLRHPHPPLSPAPWGRRQMVHPAGENSRRGLEKTTNGCHMKAADEET